ncbi:hypothetical protein ACFP75_07970 [Ornithinimicrobium tianjinense]|uniref:Uncharacterized protein n=2 Tax=Ornithinimicrobium tianjinense TaxID=1195761 RepID=A0A917BJ54_9MICO|nr:hypothetical protein GCM10011366_11810 [Ornithinimicrobium tianjinense]
MTALDHPLVQDYLRRLHEEAVRLPVDEGRELEAQIREHLADALGENPSESAVREALERLGAPAALVDEAGGVPGPDAAAGGVPVHDSAWREVGALVLLVGSALFFWLWPLAVPMWLAGLVLLVLSRRWSVADKLLGALVLGVGWLAPVLAGLMTFAVDAQTCSTGTDGQVSCTGGGDGGLSATNVVAIVLTVAFAVLYVWTLVRLARRAARGAAEAVAPAA